MPHKHVTNMATMYSKVLRMTYSFPVQSCKCDLIVMYSSRLRLNCDTLAVHLCRL